MKNTFQFDPARWLNNPALRLCSLEARGLWIDMLAIMANNGGSIPQKIGMYSHDVVAALTGVDSEKVAELFVELGGAGIFKHVAGKISSPAMVKSCAFKAKAKASGEEGARRKKSAKQA